MAMFDPIYVTEVFNDILGRRGLRLILTPKDGPGAPSEQEAEDERRTGAVPGAAAADR